MGIDSNTGLETGVAIVNYLIIVGAIYFGIKLYLKVMQYLDIKTKKLTKK